MDQRENFYKVRIKVTDGSEKPASLSYIVKAKLVSEADAKVKMHIRKVAESLQLESYDLIIISISDMKVEDLIV